MKPRACMPACQQGDAPAAQPLRPHLVRRSGLLPLQAAPLCHQRLQLAAQGGQAGKAAATASCSAASSYVLICGSGCSSSSRRELLLQPGQGCGRRLRLLLSCGKLAASRRPLRAQRPHLCQQPATAGLQAACHGDQSGRQAGTSTRHPQLHWHMPGTCHEEDQELRSTRPARN
jgi:hypothetical protein